MPRGNCPLYDRIKRGLLKVCFSGPRASPAEHRFWYHVDKEGPIVRPELGNCWQWFGSKGLKGYGNIRSEGKLVMAHRFSWELHFGAIAEGQLVCHKCHNPGCVRPQHLFLGTNHAKGDRNGSRTHLELRPRGSEHKRAKLTEAQVLEIRDLYRKGWALTRLARKYGVFKQSIQAIVRRRTWTHV